MPVKPLTSQNSTVITATLSVGGQHGPIDQPFHDARVDIFAEGFTNALLEAQLLDHTIERRRQVADLVPRGGDERFVEIAGLDGARAFQQPPDRACHACADQDREHQAEYRSERRQCGRDPGHVVLQLHRRHGVGPYQCKHVGSDTIDLLVEFVAQNVDTGKAIGDTHGISGI
jgi:hypothetical protein